MSTTKKAVLTAVGFLIAIAFALLMFNLYKKGETSINSAVSQYDDIVSEYADVKLAAFDNTTVDGSRIIDLIKDLDADSGYTITVKNGVNQQSGAEKPNGITYSAGASSFATDKANMVKKSMDECYINPNAAFDSVITKDQNGNVSNITFTQQVK